MYRVVLSAVVLAICGVHIRKGDRNASKEARNAGSFVWCLGDEVAIEVCAVRGG